MLPENLNIENEGIKNSLPYTFLTDGNIKQFSSLNLSNLEDKIEKAIDKFPWCNFFPANSSLKK